MVLQDSTSWVFSRRHSLCDTHIPGRLQHAACEVLLHPPPLRVECVAVWCVLPVSPCRMLMWLVLTSWARPSSLCLRSSTASCLTNGSTSLTRQEHQCTPRTLLGGWLQAQAVQQVHGGTTPHDSQHHHEGLLVLNCSHSQRTLQVNLLYGRL